MITFRQKEFIAPLIAALAPAVIQGGAGIIQGKKANESQERIARQQQVQAIKDRKAQEQQAKQEIQLQNNQLKAAQKQQNQLIKLAKRNPEAAAAVKPTITVGQPQEQAKTFSKVGAVLGGAANLGMGALNSGAVTTAMSMKMNKDQLKSNEKIAAKENENRALETRARIQENNNATALKMQELKNQKNEFNKSYKLARKQKAYSKATEATGFVKNLGTLAKERGLHKALAGTAVAGAVAGGGAYLVDKAIQRDIKKSGKFEVAKPEKTEKDKKKRRRKLVARAAGTAALLGGTIAAKKGAFGDKTKDVVSKVVSKESAGKVGKTFKDATKDYFTHTDETGKRRVNKLNLALTGVSLASPAVMYRMKKKQYEDQVKQSEGEEKEKTYAAKPGPGINLGKLGKAVKDNLRTKPKKYNGNIIDTTVRGRVWDSLLNKTKKTKFKASKAWKEFKKNPGESTLGAASSWFGGGGRNGVAKFGDDLEALGEKTGNQTSQRVGKAIRNNPKTALLVSIGVGGGLIKARRKAWNATSRTLEKADPNAFAYQKYGAQPIPEKDKEEKEDE